MPSLSRAAAVLGWIVVLAVVVELCAREVVRQSLLFALAGASPGHWTLAAIAIVAGAAGMLARGRLLFPLLFALGLAAQLELGARLQSDGFYYFSYLRSMAFDRDVEFSNDYRLLGLGDKTYLFEPTPTGYAHSAWTIGPAIVWSPFFAAGHVVARQLAASDPNVSANGVSFPYRQAVCVAGLFYGLLGCWFCYRLTARLFGRGLAAVATAATVAGSFMLWYLVKEPSMTHAPSMAAVAGFTWLWLATRERRTRRQWVLLGAIAGFMTLIRWQNALFALLPAYDAVVALLAAARSRDRRSVLDTAGSGLLFTAAATVAFVPQMIAWHSIYGTWLAVSPVGPQIRWSDPHLADILWSSRNGLLSWSPVLYLGAIGLAAFTAARPAMGVPLVASIALMAYFNSCIQDWWGSDGYGMRRFDGTIPMFVVGVAAFVEGCIRVTRRFPFAAVAAGGAGLVAWNLALMAGAHEGAIRLGESLSFGETARVQVQALHRWIGMPSTYPASLVFALRGGTSPAAYDLLWANRFLGDPARPYGRIDLGTADGPFIEEGWHAPEHDGQTSFRWASQRAELLVPLDHAAPLRVQVRLRALGYAGAPPQRVSLHVGDLHLDGPAIGPAWQLVEFDTPADAWRGSVNRLALQFAWDVRPSDVGLGGDTRRLAAAVDYVRVQVRDAP